MRILIFIALLCVAAQGRGQIYINSYAFGAGSDTLLIDLYPNAATAFSLRKVRAAYTGNCVTVRRASNGDTTNIGFVNNYLDTATLKTFCSGTNCFVRRWYDQSGNNRDAVQTTDANQPAIATAGNIFYKGTTPSLDFDGTNDVLEITSSTTLFNYLHNGTESAVFYAAHFDTAGGSVIFANNGTSGSQIGATSYGNTTNKILAFASNGSGNFPAIITSADNKTTTGSNCIISTLWDVDNATAASRLLGYFNGDAASWATNTNTFTPSTSNATNNMFIGGTATFSHNGGIKEIIFFNTSQSSTRTAIRDNINTFYSIY